jgi:hypothetical protein
VTGRRKGVCHVGVEQEAEIHEAMKNQDPLKALA